MNEFKKKVIHEVFKVLNSHLNELCGVWIDLFGHKCEAGLVVQLRKHLDEFLSSIKHENKEKQNNAILAIEG